MATEMNKEYKTSHPHRTQGFTLVEILAVLAVIAAIIAIGIPAIAKVLQSGRLRNAEGTANVVRSAVAAFLTKPGSPGTLPVTESALTAAPVLPASQWTGTAALNTAAASKAATLDNILLAEGVLDRPLSLRMGEQNFALPSGSVALSWSTSTESFTNTTAATADYTNASRVECAICDGVNNPGVTGAAAAATTANSIACAFNLAGNGALIPAGTRVAYLILKSVPDSDAYQLALDVDGPNLVQNTAAAPASLDQSQGAVTYVKDSPVSGFVDVYYYLTGL
jgi:prepilin-type N-terminal cleavage/methylation domain-containing protein